MAALDVRASTPPAVAARLVRSSVIGGWDRLDELWRERESWFVDVTETHTSLPALEFFRSPHWELSWVTASGTLDGASLLASTVDRPRSADAELCIRAGYVDLRRIADVPTPAQPRSALAGGAKLDRPARVRPGLPAAGRGRGAARGRPRPGVADFAGWRSTTTGCCCRWPR